MNCVRGWCISNFMKHSVNRTTVISFSRRTNLLGLDYKLCESFIACADSVIDLEMLNYSNLHFHHDVGNIFLKADRFLCLIQIVTFSFFSVPNLLVLYCTLVILQLECASVAWNSIALTDGCKLERIHQMLSLGRCCFFSHIQLCQCPQLLEISYLKCSEVSSRHLFLYLTLSLPN
jgi:hypothetical protein